MESILTGYDDPRIAVYFVPCTDEQFKNTYRGIRQGTCEASGEICSRCGRR